MGVLNVTPDSFSDGGRHHRLDDALRAADAMLTAGAVFIDVGGESTRPGAAPVGVEEELHRVLPVVRALVARGALVSLDSSKPEVIRACLEAGAHLVNDVRALGLPGAMEVVAASDAAVCLMHMQGDPGSMQRDPRYGDVVVEVGAFLDGRVAACVAAGIGRDRLLADPGFGFGKTLEHNLALLRGLPQLAARLRGLPLLAGLSRKSMLGALTGRPVGDRLAGGLALAIAAVEGGARIIRSHDVAETVDALKVWSAFRSAGPALEG
ncbi:MAG: dihydropteroate synthase [Gammaproteobacteria bacterium]